MASRRRFDASGLNMVCQALAVAEECVSDHFHLSDTSWRRYPYEVRTLAQLKPQEVSPVALAQVLRLRRPAGSDTLRPKDFFRICLQDHNLLSLVRREGASELLLPLLTYVTTHELVHVVRFYRFQRLFEADAGERRREEIQVHGITSQILHKVRLPHLDQVINLYQEHDDQIPVAGRS